MLTHKVKGDSMTVCLVGELDHHSAIAIRTELDALIEKNTQLKQLIFDLKELVFMDSSGIGVIIGRYKKMSSRGGVVSVKNPGSHVDRIFTMSGLYQIVQKA